MLNFQKIEINQSKTSENSLQNSTSCNRRKRGRISANYHSGTENELGNLWATARTNEDVYQSVVGDQKKKTNIIHVFSFQNFYRWCSLNNNETFFSGEKMVARERVFPHPFNSTNLRLFIKWRFWTGNNSSINVLELFAAGYVFKMRRSVRNCDVCGKYIRNRVFWSLFLPNRIWSIFFINFVIDLSENEKCKNLSIITEKLRKGVILKKLRFYGCWNGCRNIYSTFLPSTRLNRQIVKNLW